MRQSISLRARFLHTPGVYVILLKALPVILGCAGVALFLATLQVRVPSTLLTPLRQRRQAGIFSATAISPTAPSLAAPWHDFLRIQQHTRDLSARNVVAPTYLRHLEEFHAPDPFKTVHIVSSWVDTRPLIVDRPPQLSIIATQQGAPFIQVSNGSRYEDNPLFCYIALKKAGQTSLYTVTKSTLNGLPDVHELERHFVAVQYNCPLVLSNGDVPDWEGAEVLVTLSLAHVDPPLDVFTLATPLPILDLPRHIQGHGKSAVCIPPLTGDRYAPFIRDFIAYYQALGFTDFYAYLFSPGPESIEVLRDISTSNGIHTIRWGVPKAWTWSATQNHDPSRKFPVDPRNWNIAGIETLVPEKEYEMSGDTNGEFDILLWYYGQGAATQDCASRAMAEGMRWVAHVDWDEYLFLRPSGGQAWPPASTAAGGSAFTEWARTAEQLWTYPETLDYTTSIQLGVDVEGSSKGTLPASFTFVSAFACLKCSPTSPPPESEQLHSIHKQYPQVDWLNPGFGLPLFMSSPVRQERWFGQSRRTKFVTDPWAWWSVGIHMAGLGYAEHAATRGFCSSFWTPSPHSLRSSEDSECARKLLSTLGRNTVLVRAAPPTITSSPPSSEFGQGSIFHFRVDNKLSQSILAFNVVADKWSLDYIGGDEGSREFNKHRVDKREWKSQFGAEDMGLVQDWSMVDVMGPLLLQKVLGQKAKYGAQKWPLDGRKGKVEEFEAGLMLVAAFAILAGGFWKWSKSDGEDLS